MSNTFGTIFRFTSFGESHGAAIGGVLDGVPAGIELDTDFIQNELNRRRPGQSAITSQRDEKDRVIILSGTWEGKTTGAPIGFMVMNDDAVSADYDALKDVFRPSHADFTYHVKYGNKDHRGSGRASARETIARVVAGAIARLALKHYGITVTAYTSSVGAIGIVGHYSAYDLSLAESNNVRCPDAETAVRMEKLITEVKNEGDTIGGTVDCVIKGVPAGIGEPVYEKLQAKLASAMLSINAAKAFEYGMGFEGCAHRGSEMNDRFVSDNGQLRTSTNWSGGIQGGISNGEDIYFRVGFKPVATLMGDLECIDKNGTPKTIKMQGRHDPCVVPRAVPVVEAMAACVILDALLLARTTRI